MALGAKQDPEEVLGDLIHDDGERANSQHSMYSLSVAKTYLPLFDGCFSFPSFFIGSFDAIGDTIKVLDACLGVQCTSMRIFCKQVSLLATVASRIML